jgi:uncharacterized SAM-binding protein YcdF (DUF218 family)
MHTLGHSEAVGGQTTARDGASHGLEERVVRATEQLSHTEGGIAVYNEADRSEYRTMKRVLGIVLLTAVILASIGLLLIARQIARQSTIDEARPADVIVVLGAAEYRGRPSPVLEARLQHGLFLYQKGLAPKILTTGGAGGDPDYTEAEVGRAWLSRHGVPSEAIIAEQESESTVESVAAVAEIMRRMELHSAVVVSDGYHIYRVKKLLQARGIPVYGSPRPSQPKDPWKESWLYTRQAIAYVMWRAGIPL